MEARFLCGTFLFSPDFPPFIEQVELLFGLGHSLGRFLVFSFLLLNHGREFVYVKELEVPILGILVRIGTDVAVCVDLDCSEVGQSNEQSL